MVTVYNRKDIKRKRKVTLAWGCSEIPLEMSSEDVWQEMAIKSREEVQGSSIWASLALMVDKAVGRSHHQRKQYQGDKEAKVMVRVHSVMEMVRERCFHLLRWKFLT